MITPETIKDIFNKFISKVQTSGDKINLQNKFNSATDFKDKIKALNNLKDYLKNK